MIFIIDFDYYKNNFLGTLVPCDKFYHIEKKACVYVKNAILNKNSDITEVKDAVCAVCELIYNEEKRNGIKSENNDGYAVTYFDNPSFTQKVNDVITIYLATTGLMYCAIGWRRSKKW